MISFIGTYECKVDTKFRLPLPISLKKQMTDCMSEGFILKRSVFQNCLELHPIVEWQKVMSDLNSLNKFVKKNNDFIRIFTAGLKVVEIDSNGRIQISRDLVKFAGINKEVVLSSSVNVIEIWDKDKYEHVVNVENFDFVKLAEEVMGKVRENE